MITLIEIRKPKNFEIRITHQYPDHSDIEIKEAVSMEKVTEILSEITFNKKEVIKNG